MGDIITTLSPSTTFHGIGTWLQPLFWELWPIALVGFGIMIIAFMIPWLIEGFMNMATDIFETRFSKANKGDAYSNFDRMTNKMAKLNATSATRGLKSWQTKELWKVLKKVDDEDISGHAGTRSFD